MNDTPTIDECLQYADGLPADCWADRCIIELGAEVRKLRGELAEAQQQISEFQQACDHEWEKVDASYSHEFGTEIVRYCQCEKCGKQREWDDEGPDSDDGDPDVERERREDDP